MIVGFINIKGADGVRYSKSLLNNVRNEEGLCDFERVQSLEGIYLANIYDEQAVKMF